MASSSHDSASLPQPGSESVEDIQDALEIHKILLDSLENTSEDTPAKRAELKALIESCEKKLLEAESAVPKNSSTKPSTNMSNYDNNFGSEYEDWTSSTPSISFNDPWGEETQSNSSFTSKKRPGSHFGSNPFSGPSKSRRTSPSPFMNNNKFDDSEPIDLTGEDDLDCQRRGFESFTSKKQMEEQDAALARRLNDELNNSPSSSWSTYPPSLVNAHQGGMHSPSPNGRQTHNAFGNGTKTKSPLTPHRKHSSQQVPGLGSSSQLPTHFKSESPSTPHHDLDLQGVNGVASPFRAPMRTNHEVSPSRAYIPPPLILRGNRAPYLKLEEGQDLQYGNAFTASAANLQGLRFSQPHGSGLSAPGQDVGRRSGVSLSDIINRTNNYDYVNGTDDAGNLLPENVRTIVGDPLGATIPTQDHLRDLIANIGPDTDILNGQSETPEALACPLYKHQEVALAWMKKMEKDKQKRGGILADDMGLGKTISSLALLVSNKPQGFVDANKRPVKTTLIIGPVALIRQWEREIQTKLKPSHQLRIFMFHNKKANYHELCNYDVVLTTYGLLASEYTKLENYTNDVGARNGVVDQDILCKICPLIGPKSMFYRVILDEAQCIKNPKAKTSKAAYRLKSRHRWCLTGTPMMNNVGELASLIQFLQIKPYCVPHIFQRDFNALSGKAGDVPESMRKLQALLKAIMLRRTKASKIDGKPIVTLKEKTEEIVHVVFSTDEQDYYNKLEKESRVQFNRYLRQGTIGKHYANALAILLRLRQACCHPYLHMGDVELINGDIPEEVMVELTKKLDPEVVTRIKQANDFDCPICMDAVANPSIMFPCGHDLCSPCFVQLMETAKERGLQQGQETEGMTCPTCRGDVAFKKVISYEIFKQVHMPESIEPVALYDETDSGFDSDSEDGFGGFEDDVDDKGNLAGFVVDDDESDDDYTEPARNTTPTKKSWDSDGVEQSSDLEDINDIVQRSIDEKSKKAHGSKSKKFKAKRPQGKGKQRELQPQMLNQLRRNASRNPRAYRKYMSFLKRIWLPSAKVDKCRDLIAEIQSTGEKTIVFSQWTLLLDLLEIPLKNELKLKYSRYDGSMTATQRDNAAREFQEETETRVMLVSLKAGNAGLNLTAASQVIIMDPFWNPYIEMQAVDRAYRIGQQKPVKVHRILIKDTVEDRIVTLQEEKRQLVDSALDEKAATNIARLGARELGFLFGITD
ncbi:SNF2 family N-terminal domain-containing protein [Biscogniauxia mediterranea]|nr:SNF2 family N-terminal domain-containing protein [Biscogniauxia mediterranea]